MKALLLIMAIAVLIHGCNDKPTGVAKQHKANEAIKDPLLNRNKESIRLEQRDIENYIRRQGHSMIKTGTGLHYQLIKDEPGSTVRPEQQVLVEHSVSLLNGNVCYSTSESGPEAFIVEHDEVESGLHEGIQLMSPGDSAILIIPSYLAFGLSGDLEKIPMRSTVIYNIKLLAVR